MSNTELISATSYNVKNMIFSEPMKGSIPNSPITFQRINISSKNVDGSVGPLVIATERLFSFGVSENKDIETQKVNGYVMPLCLYNKNGASDDEKTFVNVFNKIVDYCKEHLVKNREVYGQYDLELNDLKKLNPIYTKKVNGKVVPGASPTLYAKLISSKKQEKPMSVFFDEETGEELDPLELLGKYCNCRAVIKIESIFIGNKISLQVKLYEAEVKLIDYGMKKLLPRPSADSIVRVVSSRKEGVLPLSIDDDDFDDDVGSLVADVDETETNFPVEDPKEDEEETKPVVAPKKIVKKVIKKVVKKEE